MSWLSWQIEKLVVMGIIIWLRWVLDDSAVAVGGLPGSAGVREFPSVAGGAGDGRAGNPAVALPRAALHRHGAGRLAGALPPLQGQPLADTQQHLRRKLTCKR